MDQVWYILSPQWALDLGVAQVRLDLADLAKLLLGVGGADGRRNNHVVTHLPVDGSGNTLLVAGLQRINDTEDFGGVAAGGGRVHHGQTDLLAWVDDEDRADGERNALLVDVVQILLVDHVVQKCNLAVGIGDNGELDIGGGDFVDVFDPLAVGADVVGALLSYESV